MIMQTIAYLLEPNIFYSLLIGIFILSLIVIFRIHAKKTKTISGLENKIKLLNEELSIKDKMYEGLKGQYDELDKTSLGLAVQLQQQDKPKSP